MDRDSSTMEIQPVNTTWTQFRDRMPVTKKWAYFDHAAVAPIPQSAHDAIVKWASEIAAEGDAVWPSWRRQHENCRNISASLINAKSDEIALIPNTTFGINLVADGFNWQSGDNVVLPEQEFPSNIYPWMALQDRGVEIRQVPLDGHKICLDRLIDACDERTKIVSVSWVGYASGYRIDPKQYANAIHEAGALFFLDAIQGLGVFPLDVVDADIDFLAADGHKWMLGPEGAGIFYLKKQHLPLLRPMNVGWGSVAQGTNYTKVELNFQESAARYEGGTQNMAGFIGLNASLELLLEFGLTHTDSPIAERVIVVTDKIVASLTDANAIIHSPRNSNTSSGIVLFEVPGHDPVDVRLRLLDQKVVTSCRAGHMRVAAHCYNDGNDIDRLIETIKKIT